MTESLALRRTLAVVKYVGLGAAVLALSQAEIMGIRPFGAAFLLALVFCGMPFVFAAPVFFLGELLASPTVGGVIYAFAAVACAFIGRVLLVRLHKGRPAIMAVAAVLAQSGLLFGLLSGEINLLQMLVWGVIGAGLTFLCCGFVRPVLINRMRYKLLETEIIACGILLAATALGLAHVHIYTFPVLPLAALPILLLCAYMGGPAGALVGGICLGLGAAVHDFSVAPVAAYVFMALIASMFVSAPRIIGAASVILAYILFMFFFNVDYTGVFMDFWALTAGAVVYMCLPRKLLDECKAWLTASHAGAAARNMINRARQTTGNALLQSGRIFEEMGQSLSDMPQAVQEFSGQIENGVCKDCALYARCSSLAGFQEALDRVTESATEKGRASVSELPVFLSENCSHLTRLITFASEHAEKNREAMLRTQCEYAARGIVAEQLDGMAKVLRKLGEDAARPAQFDRAKEQLLLEELNYRGVVASEALVTGGTITIIARTETINKAVTERAVSRIMRSPFVITSADTDELAGFTVLSCERSPHFDVVFAASGVPKRKGDKSGDTHSFIKIGSDKFMMALCDGMGTGESAERASEAAIGLVESFYKAGFDHDLVLGSVNKFLSLGGDERFNALDICVIDLNSGKADIIKFGCPATIIKGKDTVRAVEGSALPMGALAELRPSLQTVELTGGEMLVMTSDGVSDCFEGQSLLSAVNNLRTKNPVLVADGLLEHTLSKNAGLPKDDSTVLCARIFERV